MLDGWRPAYISVRDLFSLQTAISSLYSTANYFQITIVSAYDILPLHFLPRSQATRAIYVRISNTHMRICVRKLRARGGGEPENEAIFLA